MRVALGERKLSEWANNKAVNLSKSGAVWLTLALDPYHDDPLPPCSGWPDVSTASSVVSCVKQTMQVSATSGGHSPLTDNWDLHIALVPDMQASELTKALEPRHGNTISYNGAVDAPTIPFGGLMARGVFQSGAPIVWTAPNTNPAVNLGTLQLPPVYGSGLSRIIGLGFEVHNTTAELSKQGSVVYYRQPEPKRTVDVWTLKDAGNGSTSPVGIFGGNLMRLPPDSVAEAMQLSGSREFKAKDGAYVVAAFHSNENPPLPVSYTMPIWQQAGDEEQLLPQMTILDNTGPVWFPRSTVNNQQLTSLQAAQPKKLFPFHQCGCIFSGLSPTSTFTVNMIMYIESFPSVNNPLTVLATPSARYDPVALEIYSKALSRIPTGVPVRENGLGQWFSDVIAEIEPFVTPLMTALHPAAGAISKGIGVANQSYRAANGPSMLPAPKKKKKTKAKNAKLDNGSRGKKGNIQGPMRQGK